LIPGDASHDKLGTAKRWRAAVLSPSHQYSKVVTQLSAAIIGRDAFVNWMSVAAIPARDWASTAAHRSTP
jgi:hypothetical protein